MNDFNVLKEHLINPSLANGYGSEEKTDTRSWLGPEKKTDTHRVVVRVKGLHQYRDVSVL